jgi:choline dehydrogenase
VVDQWCNVRGVDGVRVVDASVMPALPSVPIGFTCAMLAERVADWMS